MLEHAMFVVTTRADDDELSGCLVGFATQTSIHPRRFLVGVSRTNHTFGVAARSDYLAVHVVARRNVGLARLFGSQTGDTVDKFEECDWHAGPQGMPILDDAAGWFVGATLERINLDGDHVGYLLEPIAAAVNERSAVLVSASDVAGLEPGHKA
jgi:flavin reductase (DIM6/NTAB) family NADH-FMN oxidoreductase RutF